MPISTPYGMDFNSHKKVTDPPKTDLGLPNYDRSMDRGNYLVISLDSGTVEFSSYCASFSRALSMTRLSKRNPTWVISGLEDELAIIRRLCAMKADWLTPKMFDRYLKTQLGKTVRILTTYNL